MLLLGSILFFGSNTWAATTSTTLGVSTNVVAACTVSTTAIAFPSNYTLTQSDGAGSILVTCTTGTKYDGQIDAGANAGSATAYTNRKMANGANTLSYQIYSDSARSVAISPYFTSTIASGGGVTMGTGTTTATTNNHTIYARIPANQTTSVSANPVTDTLNVLITYQ